MMPVRIFRSAAGLEIKRQVLPWFAKDGEIKTPDGKNGFTDNDAKKNPYLEQYWSWSMYSTFYLVSYAHDLDTG